MRNLMFGDKAPNFTVTDINGECIQLEDYKGQHILLTFYRYATCPFCTVHFGRIMQEYEKYKANGVKVIAVFESSSEYIKRYISRHGAPFPIIADPEGKLYNRYNVKKSMLGLFIGMFRMPSLLKALLNPMYRPALPDGNMSRIPADFVINTYGIIVDAHYGANITDHMPFWRIDTHLRIIPQNKIKKIDQIASIT